MISYEDARRFRDELKVPLDWDENIPPPPRNRTEFTRLILEASKEVGLSLRQWNTQISYDSSEKEFLAFQSIIHRFTHHQFFHGVPKLSSSISTDFGHSDGYRVLSWKEYIEQLEDDYYEPWKTSWLFGMCDGGEQRVLLSMKNRVSDHLEAFSRGDKYSDALKYPDAAKIEGNEIIAHYLDVVDGRDLSLVIGWEMKTNMALVEERWLGLRGDWLLLIPPVIGFSCLIISVLGVVRKHYSAWLLAFMIPLFFVLVVIGTVKMAHGYKICWINKTLTFRELATKIVEIKKHEWEELQDIYAVV